MYLRFKRFLAESTAPWRKRETYFYRKIDIITFYNSKNKTVLKQLKIL